MRAIGKDMFSVSLIEEAEHYRFPEERKFDWPPHRHGAEVEQPSGNVQALRYRPRRRPRDARVAEIFENLRVQWRQDTQFESSSLAAAVHPLYQRIIGLGPDVIPLILRSLDDGQAPLWFWALQALCRSDPAAGAETVSAAVAAWKDWGRRAGHLRG